MKPNNQVILKLPFRKGGFFSITVKKKIGFVFDNAVSHMVFINSGAKNADDFKKWCNKDNGTTRNAEFLYCAAVRYGEVNRVKDKFTKESLLKALAEASKEDAQKLADCVKRSENYGATYKKKPKAKR